MISGCTTAETAQYILEHLQEDIEVLAAQQQQQQQPLSPSLIISTDSNTSFNNNNNNNKDAFLVLQVQFVEDISLSADERLQILAGESYRSNNMQYSIQDDTRTRNHNNNNNNANNEEEEEDDEAEGEATNNNNNNNNGLQAHLDDMEALQKQHQLASKRSSGANRCLKFILSDGYRRVTALEVCNRAVLRRLFASTSTTTNNNNNNNNRNDRFPVLFPDGVALGAKLKVTYTPTASPALLQQHGVLRLYTGNTTLLGGAVLPLCCYSALEAGKTLDRRTGRPSRLAAAASLPPPQPPVGPSHPPTHDSRAAASPHSEDSDDVVVVSAGSGLEAPPPPPPPPPAAAAAAAAHLFDISNISSASSINNNNTNSNANNVSGALVWRPLSQFAAFHAQPTNRSRPFLTTVQPVAAASDLAYTSERPPHGGGLSAGRYTLLVEVKEPDNNNNNNNNTSNNTSARDSTYIVDLGHHWLERQLGMPVAPFAALAASPEVADQRQLQTVTARLSRTLERVAVMTVVLREREDDQVVEMVEVREMVLHDG